MKPALPPPADPARADPVSGSACVDPVSGPARVEPDSGPHTDLETRFHGTSRFRAPSVLGRGGMGVVYRAFDAEMGREVALKTLPRLSPQEQIALKDEFRALAHITHPNIIELYDLVVDDDGAFFTMELLDGDDLVRHVRGAPESGLASGRVARLLACAPQLAAAVRALHADGRLHRDIKPSNVLVTRTGRLVLLDFGLALAVGPGGLASGRRAEELAGTLEYMPPEQAWGGALSTAADWYAVGVVLYEALTGTLPFQGEPEDLIHAKSHLPPRRPLDLDPSIPAPLDEIVLALLSPDPARRATGDDLARALAALGAPTAHLPAGIPIDRIPFVGRQEELGRLRAALAHARAGGATLLRVHGTSGIGKTELLRRFTADVERQGAALVLEGRCHPHESVPYKAFDGVVDMLARELSDLAGPAVTPKVQRGAAALVRLFPALSSVEPLAVAPSLPPDLEPRDLRRHAFEALGDLLSATTSGRPRVVWIDDLQWGDHDSLALLRELLSRRDPVLYLASYRAEEATSSDVLLELDRLAATLGPRSLTLAVEPLLPEHARELAARLLPADAEKNTQRASDIASDARGSPFFIAQLAQLRSPAAGPHAPRLSGLLDERISGLTPEERHLVTLVALAGGPLDRSIALRAAGLGESGRPDVARLGRARLLRTTEIAGRPAVETYHDRIREAALQRLEAPQLQGAHLTLARTLRADPDADPETLFRHYLGAREISEATRFGLEAAERASRVLAFDRASQLYKRVLDLDLPAPSRPHVLERLAESLVDAGRGAESAPHFVQCAQLYSNDRAKAQSLRRQAAEQLVRSGRVEEGTAIFERVLHDVGVRMPRDAAESTRRSVRAFAKLLLRGTRFSPRSAADLPEARLERLDALWGACGGLTLMNPPAAAALGTEQLLEALRAGEPSRLAYGLLYVAVLHGAIGGGFLRRRAERLLALGEELAHHTGDPTLRGQAAFARGSLAWHSGRFPEAVESCDRAFDIYARECRGTMYHRVASENYALSAMAFRGHLGELSARRRRALKRAEDVGDTFGTSVFRIGQVSLCRLAEDEPDAAIADSDSVGATWPLRLYHHTVITTQAELYRRDAEAALRTIQSAWDALSADRVLTLELPRIELTFLRGSAALGALASRLRGALPRARGAPTVSEVTTWARQIARSDQPPAAPFAAALRAGAEWLQGRFARSRDELRSAQLAFEEAGMDLHAASCALALGPHAPPGPSRGPESPFHRIRDLGVRRPDRMARTILPWLPDSPLPGEDPEEPPQVPEGRRAHGPADLPGDA